ncbi:hypothetical protein AB1N83_013219 [Pleurotus pulmonarius]
MRYVICDMQDGVTRLAIQIFKYSRVGRRETEDTDTVVTPHVRTLYACAASPYPQSSIDRRLKDDSIPPSTLHL